MARVNYNVILIKKTVDEDLDLCYSIGADKI